MSLDERLHRDVRLLGDLLGSIIRIQSGEETYSRIEKVRLLGKAIANGDISAATELTKLLQKLPEADILLITKAFSQFLNLANIAEQYNKIRIGQNNKHQGLIAELIQRLIGQNVAPAKLYEAICNLDIQFVLTAHPTEIRRRTIIRIYNQIFQIVQKLDLDVITVDQRTAANEQLRDAIALVWLTPDVRSQKPTPLDEADWGFEVIKNSIWHAVPAFLRQLNRVSEIELGQALPLDLVPLRIDSWLGGDRDGNPKVTAVVTRRVIFNARKIVADLLLQEITSLQDNILFEPYDELLAQVQIRLQETSKWAHDNIVTTVHPQEPIYVNSEEILESLMACYNDLIEKNSHALADGHLTDIIRKIHCFGMTLVRTDIRQEAAKHAQLMTVITQCLGLGDYDQWEEEKRCQFILDKLSQHGSLPLDALHNDSDIQDQVQTFKNLAVLPRESLGVYIISMAAEASDILAVVLLQREFGIKELLPIVPLFETYDDLKKSSVVLETLLSCTAYRDLIKGYQQVMIGYSDSAKDVGMFASAWAQYSAQEEMQSVANKFNVKLVFFHGRGGSIARGGWPIHQALLAQPPLSIQGHIRITEQGEVMQNRFGLSSIAMQTFESYISAILEADLLPPTAPTPNYRKIIDKISKIAATEYRKVVVEDQNFLQYFQQVTPINELKELNIGSRPSARANSTSLHKLRAIPWVFAWMQNRMLLPSWVGVGPALQYVYDKDLINDVQDMYKDWPFFNLLMDMLEQVLAKTDKYVITQYETHLLKISVDGLPRVLRKQLAVTTDMIMRILNQDHLLANNQVLDRSIKLRNPYLLPLHFIQVELLYRVRDGIDEPSADLREALLTSIAGIAAGMRTTG